MTQTTDLTPLQRDALLAMHQAPTHALVRQGRMYGAPGAHRATSGTAQVRLFTKRLVRMLERAALVDFDEPDFPTRVTLSPTGEQLAAQLHTADQAKARAA